MKSSKLFLILALHAAVAAAGPEIDMDDPRRALGREDDIRVDAQILQDAISPGAVIGVTYRIQNLTAEPVAVAEKVCSSSYDPESRTVTLAIGSEIPAGGLFPKLTMIASGETKTFTAGAPLNVASAARLRLTGVPRLLQIKVSVLRHLAPFAALLRSKVTKHALSDQQFEDWLESNDTILLNPVPVRFDPRRGPGSAEVSGRSAGF